MTISQQIHRSKNLIILCSIMLIGAFLRCFAISKHSIWVDEALQYYNSNVPVAFLQQTIAPQETFFSFIIDRCLNALHLDWSIAALRSRSAIVGVATIPFVYAIFDTLIGRRAAVISAFAAAFCPILIQYGQEFRMYNYVVFFDIVASWSAINYSIRRNNVFTVAYACSMILSLYSHFLSLLVFISLTVFLFGTVLSYYQSRDRNRLDFLRYLYGVIGVTILIGVADLSSLPAWARFFFWEKLGGDAGGHLPLNYGTMSVVLGQYQGVGTGIGFIVSSALTILGWIVAVKRSPKAAWFGAIWILLPLLAFSVTGGTRILTSNRYVVFLFPVYVGFLANGIVTLTNRITAAAMRYYKDSSRPHLFGSVLGASVVIALYLPGVMSLYVHNPKFLTYDLADIYGLLNASLRQGDLLIEMSGDDDPSSGGQMQHTDPAWFRFYDSFFEKDQPASVREHIIIAEPSLTAESLRLAMKDRTRLMVLTALTPTEEKRAESGHPDAKNFDMRCFPGMCLTWWKGPADTAIATQIRTFATEFGWLAPGTMSLIASLTSPVP